jgi:hypothetical protein
MSRKILSSLVKVVGVFFLFLLLIIFLGGPLWSLTDVQLSLGIMSTAGLLVAVPFIGTLIYCYYRLQEDMQVLQLKGVKKWIYATSVSITPLFLSFLFVALFTSSI